MKQCWEEREKVGKAVRTSGSERPKGHCGDKDKAEIRETGRERESNVTVVVYYLSRWYYNVCCAEYERWHFNVWGNKKRWGQTRRNRQNIQPLSRSNSFPPDIIPQSLFVFLSPLLNSLLYPVYHWSSSFLTSRNTVIQPYETPAPLFWSSSLFLCQSFCLSPQRSYLCHFILSSLRLAQSCLISVDLVVFNLSSPSGVSLKSFIMCYRLCLLLLLFL